MDKVLKNQWHAVGLAAELTEDKPLAATILGEEVVVWRAAEKICAWKDLCVHRGVRLSLGKVCNNRLRCAYHGWEYNDEGQCELIPADPEARIPAKACAQGVYRACEHAGLIWVNLGDEPAELPILPQHDDSDFRVLAFGPFELDACATRAVENFLDLGHPPILHADYLGTPEHAKIPDYEVENLDDGFAVKGVRYYQPDPDGTGRSQEVIYDFGILAPLTVYFVKHVGEEGSSDKYICMFNVRPVNETKSYAYFSSAYNYETEFTDEEIGDFHTTIIMQDKPIVESQRPELLPMDLSEEIHLRSDRAAVTYRRHLKSLGVTFGTD